VHNNQRDGLHRQAIARGRVAYEPNSLGGGCPFQAGMKGFVSFPKAIESGNEPVDKVRGKPEKFAEHYNQATLFFESQTPVERAHIKNAFRFELSKVTIPAIRRRMVSGLRNVSEELAAELSADLGFEVPDPMPRAIKKPPSPEITSSPALSLMALPGDGTIATRKVAILMADGIQGAPVSTLIDELTKAGAVTRLLSRRLGTIKSADDTSFEVDATLENSPPVLFDALVLPDGIDAVERLAKDGHTLEFLKDQYRHGKSILVLGAASKLLKKAGIFEVLPSGEPDPGLLVAEPSGYESAVKRFVAAIARHRHPERDTDPPLI
jgi:catalase